MAKTAQELITILRNVTGRVDASDPLFTDTTMLGYLNDFIKLEAPQDIRIFKNKTWWEFTLGTADPDPYPVVLEDLVLASGVTGASTIEPPAYVDGYKLFWYQTPSDFYRIWPETTTYQTQRPTYVLYYNNTLTFRGPPDKTYNVKIAAYQVEIEIQNGVLETDYLYRYICYGAALNIFADYGEIDKYQEIMPVFMRYRSLIYNRTYAQQQNQRSNPEF